MPSRAASVPTAPTEAIKRNIGGGGITLREPQAFRTGRSHKTNANTVSRPRARKGLLP